MTPQEIKNEILAGPLSVQFAAHWQGVFPSEPRPEGGPELDRWNRIAHRFGKLTPDAIFGLKEVFSRKVRTRPMPTTVAAFTRFLAHRGLLRKVKEQSSAPGLIGDVCDLIVTITNSASENTVDPSDPTIASMIDTVVQAGVASNADRDAFLAACSRPCSRAEELNWSVTGQDLIAAKEIS